MNAGLHVNRWAKRRPDSCALFDRDRERTWRELDDRTNRLANVLISEFRVRPGERVALLTANRIEVAEVLVACHKARAVYVGLNVRFDADELADALDNAAPVLLVVAGEFAAQATAVATPRGIPTLDLDDAGPRGYEARLASADETAPASSHQSHPGDVACVVYTSGTTGRAKGVTFDHAAVLQHATIACVEYEIGVESRYLVQIPHNSSVNITIMPCLAAGAALGFADSRSFDPPTFAGLVASAKVTHTFLVPTQLMRILDQLADDDMRLSGLTTLGYGSSPIAPDRLRQLVDRYGPIFIQLYGMAEVASIGTLLRKDDHVRALDFEPRLFASAGRPSWGVDVLVVDDEGAEVETGERGEVVFSGSHVMLGYYRDAERTADALVNGRMHSGDIGIVDDEGYVYIVDRKKNLIIRGGQNIAPTEIENTLYRHEAVLDACVVGAPDEEWGERVVAVVTLRPGLRVSESELIDFVNASGLARFKRPEQITVVDAIPKNSVGKIDKALVRGWYWTDGRAV